jgi:hypothetical protein
MAMPLNDTFAAVSIRLAPATPELFNNMTVTMALRSALVASLPPALINASNIVDVRVVAESTAVVVSFAVSTPSHEYAETVCAAQHRHSADVSCCAITLCVVSPCRWWLPSARCSGTRRPSPAN